MEKRGQVKMSFGTIFSIILIIAFIGFAFFAIQKFLGIQKLAQTKQFSDSLQNDVTNAWTGAQAAQTQTYTLPTSIQQICFSDTSTDNLKLYASNSVQAASIEHLNLTAMIPPGESSVCYNVNKGEIKLLIKKNFGETLVTVSQNGQ